jgi:hypothetical protein
MSFSNELERLVNSEGLSVRAAVGHDEYINRPLGTRRLRRDKARRCRCIPGPAASPCAAAAAAAAAHRSKTSCTLAPDRPRRSQKATLRLELDADNWQASMGAQCANEKNKKGAESELLRSPIRSRI